MTLNQMVLNEKFQSVSTMTAVELKDFKIELHKQFEGNYHSEHFKRGSDALALRMGAINQQYDGDKFETVKADYAKHGGLDSLMRNIAKKMDKTAEYEAGELSESVMKSFYNEQNPSVNKAEVVIEQNRLANENEQARIKVSAEYHNKPDQDLLDSRRSLAFQQATEAGMSEEMANEAADTEVTRLTYLATGIR